jgi:hypothetical protein
VIATAVIAYTMLGDDHAVIDSPEGQWYLGWDGEGWTLTCPEGARLLFDGFDGALAYVADEYDDAEVIEA